MTQTIHPGKDCQGCLDFFAHVEGCRPCVDEDELCSEGAKIVAHDPCWRGVLPLAIHNSGSWRFNNKRTRLPLTLHLRCPNCQDQITRDMTGPANYLNKPFVNEPFDMPLYCRDGCGHEWTERMTLQVDLVRS